MSKKGECSKDRSRWDQRYIDGNLPWDSGKPDIHLRRVIEEYSIKPCKALEIGCGTGTNSIWLAKQGFDMTALDLSPTAIAKANVKVAAAGVRCHLLAGDFLVDRIPGAPFEFVYDRGCFNLFDSDENQSGFACRVADILLPNGMWHSLIGSTEDSPEIVTIIEPHFEILELRPIPLEQERFSHIRAWVLVAQRRGQIQISKITI